MLNRLRLVLCLVVLLSGAQLAGCGGASGENDDSGGGGGGSSGGGGSTADDSPVAVDDLLVVDEDDPPTEVDVLANDDFGADGAADGAITIITPGPADGTATVLRNGTLLDPTDDTIRYEPDTGFHGTDSFTYRIEDADGDADTATVNVTVDAVGGGGSTPSAGNDSLTVDEDDGATNIDVLANDDFGLDGPAGKAIDITSVPSDGTATVRKGGTPSNPTDDSIDYAPDPNFNGSDSFSYRIEDSNGDTATAIVSVTVNSINDEPSASDDSLTVDEDDPPTTVNVLVNDDFGGDGAASKAIVITSDPSNGTATVDKGGSPNNPTNDTIDYEPGADYNGPDEFTYRIEDSDGDTASAIVSVTVNPVNDVPNAANDSLTVEENDPATAVGVLGNDSFGGDGPGSSAIVIGSDPTDGSATVVDNGTASDPTDDDITYQPDTDFSGSDSFTYTIEDTNGDTDTATVNVTVNAAGTTTGIVYIKASDSADPNERFGGAYPNTDTGRTLAMSDDGTTLAIGAPGVPSGSAAGAVYVLVNSGGTWSFQQTITASDGQNFDQFGTAVALSANGNTLAVGTPDDGASSFNDGSVYVYTRSGGSWSEQQNIKGSNTGAGDRFGYSVALSEDGDTLAVGAIREDSSGSGPGGAQNDNLNEPGAAYVFTRSSGNWSEEEYIKSDTPETQDFFGYSVALSATGDTLAVGSQSDGNTEDPPNAGAVHVYIRGGTTWTSQQTIEPGDAANSDRFGSAVALSADGNTLAAGAPQDDNFLGSVYVYTRSSGNWSQQQKLTASNGDPAVSGDGDIFGSSVTLSDDGDTLVAGAPKEDSTSIGLDGGTGNNGDGFREAGAAYRFTRSGGTWTEQTYIKATNTEEDDRFGQSVVLSGDATTYAVGAGGENGGDEGVNANDSDNSSANSAGAVYVY